MSKSTKSERWRRQAEIDRWVAAEVSAVMPRKNETSKLAEESAATAENPTEPVESAGQTAGLEPNCNEDEVAALAYKLWQERGCPNGSDQEDWFRAENELKNRKVLAKAS